ncbi:hypothetical protein SS50377_24138 [Spironucleus salmonicida]|uniref:Uncharacterized protein n=1 Tax=Spironucleus salmonicida TaxID=348837 RepID=V6LZ55_9EUKA|nr:hypothetical protein SS50377_24138 [Spironucleus salmonicida]|eukprot:EST49021.1 Hypothetical protein SS50377_10713 [Spironucleus salmonicida]
MKLKLHNFKSQYKKLLRNYTFPPVHIEQFNVDDSCSRRKLKTHDTFQLSQVNIVMHALDSISQSD